MLVYLIIIITAYLLGNISTSYIVAKRLAGVDIRTQGSGNAGSTNVNLDYTTCAYIAVVAVVLGHNYPVFLGFKGGKGVATSLGSMLGMNPLVALLCLGFFIIIVAITKYVSLGSILGIGLSPIIMMINHNTKGVLVTLFLTISVVITDIETINRLLNGTERKLGQKKN